MEDNLRGIEQLLEPCPEARLLDIGCDDGRNTQRFAQAVGTGLVSGVEVVEQRAAEARGRGIEVVTGDVGAPLPFAPGSFEAVVSNQVIEHLSDTDLFVDEIRRVLVPGGYAVVSTENLASWHNVAALTLGWQPFSLTNVSSERLGLGNPLAVHRGDDWEQPSTWQHRRVFAYRGLSELFEAHGLGVEQVRGSGYYPLPRALARLDPRHAAFLTVKARKPGTGPSAGLR